MKLLDQKVALVTGAGRGFGAGIARALGRAGARVCLTDINQAELAATAAELAEDGSEGLALVLDVSDRLAFERVTQQIVTRWGRVDALVHAAILMPLQPFESTTDASWKQQIDVGFGGLYNGTRALWPLMKAQGSGHIIGIASGSSVRGYTDEVAYCTIKHGQEGFVKALSLEAANYGIALNTIGPGKPIKTTRVTRAELAQLPAEATAEWADPVELGAAFAWLISQPPSRFSGLRFDAGPLADTIAREGYDFAFAPEKVTLYVADFLERQTWYAQNR